MNKRCAALLSLLLLGACGCKSKNAGPDEQITSMLREIDSRRIEASVRTLAGFGTRHTLSETESDVRGIGAARRWIKAQLDQYARESGGRLQVEFQATRVERTSARVPRPVTVVNVIATLPGAPKLS